MTHLDQDAIRAIAHRAMNRHLDVDSAVILEFHAIAPLLRRGVPALEIVHELEWLMHSR